MSSFATVPPYLFHDQGTFDAPFEFDVPASLEVQPYTAHATFDGSGASGQFRPCLTFYGVDGIVLGRYFPSTIMQPGDVSEVTYTPPFGTAAVDSGGGGITEITSNDGSIVVTDPDGPSTDLAVTPAVVEQLEGTVTVNANSDAKVPWSKVSGTTLLDLTTATDPKFITAGAYQLSMLVQLNTPLLVSSSQARIFFSGGIGNAGSGTVLPYTAAANAHGGPVNVGMAYASRFGTTQPIELDIANDDLSNNLSFFASLTVLRTGN